MKLKRILKWSARALLFALILAFLAGFIAYWSSTNDCNRNAATPNNPMKAIVNCEYGVENLQLRELEKPTPNDNEVLVRVRAASIMSRAKSRQVPLPICKVCVGDWTPSASRAA